MATFNINASWSGVGGGSATVVYWDLTNAVYAEFDGESSWSLTVYDQFMFAEFDGVGGGVLNYLNYWDTGGTAEFDGVGLLTAHVQPTKIIDFQPQTWPGFGSFQSYMLLPKIQLGWYAAGYGPLILDATSGAVYAPALTLGAPMQLLFNVGVPIPTDYDDFTLTITRPDGTSYVLVDPNSYQIGAQPFVSLGWVPTPYFRTGYYLVYSFMAGELNQPGMWTVSYEAAGIAVAMQFVLAPLARAA